MTHEDQGQDQPTLGAGDEFEMHTEAMRAPSPPAHAHPTGMGRRGRPRVMSLALAATALVVLIVVVIAAFAVTPGGGINGSNPISGVVRSVLRVTPNPTPTPTRIPYPTPTLSQETMPAIGPAPAPGSCSPPAAPTHTLPATVSGAIGGSPVWVASFDGSQATRYINPGGAGHGRYGWAVAVFFAIEPGFTDPVVMRGERLDDGTPVWMEVAELGQTEAAPSVAVVLDPQQPGLAKFQQTSFGLSDDWAAWDGMLFVPDAGCYALKASWPGGSWTRTFVAG